MKLVREILYENTDYMNYINFTERDTDPIKDMGIGRKLLIEKWLNEIKINDYKLTKKYSINVYNSVFLDDENLSDFPEYITFNHIMGGFHIKNNNLNSLRGCPYSVSGSFISSNNNLTNLKNGPHIVKEVYAASHNRLESLEGIAEIVGRSIYINNNNLKSLEYIPTIIKGDLDISENPIETLKYFPSEIEGHLVYTVSEILTQETISKHCKVWGHLIEKK
jgi:hypothetical protein